jgi:tetratricopeptide (TPR) repeat protein
VHSTPRPSDQSTQHRTPREGDPRPEPAPLPIGRGDTLGRYVVLERLGFGGMGEVFAAYDPELDRKIAVKLLRPREAGSRSSAASERLIREAKAMAKLSHRNVITVYDVGEHAGRVFVAMEFLDGGTLADWLSEGPHPWATVVERYRAAGAGLAAAHAEGLVHRDFKPANVLLGSDGRVRVADFGLARRARDVPERPLAPVPEPDAEHDTERDALSQTLTQAGTMLGTPAYMAPEQYEGGTIDARADQFSFCVALYEALYGERPFFGDNLHAIMLSVAQARIREPPTGSSVPGWLRRILLRGLAYKAEQRWPDMDALLAKLRRTPARVRRAFAFAGVLGLGLVLAGVGFGQHLGRSTHTSEPPVCVGSEQALGDAFDAGDRAAIEQRFMSLGAGATSAELLARLDEWARGWRDGWVDACRATRVRGEQSEDLLDRRMTCLDLARSRFTAFVDTMAQADQAMASKALELLGELGSLESCSDRAALLRQVPLPSEPERVALVHQAQSMLEQVRLLQLAGRPREAAKLLDQQRSVVERADWGPLTAVFQAAEGWQLQREDRAAEGERLLKRAFATAISVGDDSLARAIARRVAASGKDDPTHAGESLEWLDLATALAIREGSDDAVLAQLALVRGQILITLGDYEHAQQAAAEGLERLSRAEPEGTAVGTAHYQLAVGDVLLGRYSTALTHLDRAEEAWSRQLGPDHLNFLSARTQRGQIAREAGELGAAREAFEHVLAVKRENYGLDSGEVLTIELALARTLAELGEAEQALTLAQHVVAQRRSKLAPQHSLVGQALLGLATVEWRAGELEQAHVHAIEAEQILRAIHDSTHPNLVEVLWIRGELERERGELDASTQLLLEAKAILERRQSLHSLAWLRVATALAETQLRAGSPEQALRSLDESSTADSVGLPEHERRQRIRAAAERR